MAEASREKNELGLYSKINRWDEQLTEESDTMFGVFA